MKTEGYTFFELIIVLSILTIIAMMSTVDFRSLHYHLKTKKLAGRIVREIQLSRSLAISQQQRIAYCSLNNDSWHLERSIKTAKGRILHYFGPLPKQYQLQLRNSLNQNNHITFMPLGFLQEQRCSFYLTSPTEVIRIIVGLSGNVRVIYSVDKNPIMDKMLTLSELENPQSISTYSQNLDYRLNEIQNLFLDWL